MAEQDAVARLGRFAGTTLTYGARPTDWTLASVEAGHDGGDLSLGYLDWLEKMYEES